MDKRINNVIIENFNNELEFKIYDNESDFGFYFIYLKNLTEHKIVIKSYPIDYINIKPLNNIQIVDNIIDKEKDNSNSNNNSNNNKESIDYKKSVSCVLKKYIETIQIYELIDDSWNCDFKVGNPDYSIDKDSVDKKITNFIADNLCNCEQKDKLGPDLLYYEMETADGILLIVENTSFYYNYKVKINLNKYVNLKKPLFSNSGFKIKANRFDFIKLFKRDKDLPIDFSFGYTYKKIS